MEILYVSSVPSPNEFYRMKKDIRPGVNVTTYGMNESGFKFHTLIINGLCELPNTRVTSLVGRSVSFRTHFGLFWGKTKEQLFSNLLYKHLGFINYPIVKHLCIGFSFFFETLKWQFENRGKEKAIIMDASYITALPFVLLASKFSKSKTTSIFCDLYEYMADVKDARKNDSVSMIRRIARKITQKSYRQIDSYVFLTEQMNSIINLSKKPYIVMEGIVDSGMKKISNSLENKTDKTVLMYAGALREAYGLKDLIEGFLLANLPNTELWVFGDGDYKNDIKRYSKENEKIFFGGSIPLSEVVQKELQATLLINPRPVNQDFTQYSFPSKNMEYMVSGTPVLTSKLPGMPMEYYDYVFTIENDGAYYIAKALKDISLLSRKELHSKGIMARNFVLERKNNIIQSKRIVELLRMED